MKRLGNYLLLEKDDLSYVTSEVIRNLGIVEYIVTTRRYNNEDFDMKISKEENIKNYYVLKEKLGIPIERSIFSKQTHSDIVYVVDEKDISEPFWSRKFEEVDGLITSTPNLSLVTTYADCTPVVAVDPVKKVVGICHSGWKGTIKEISKKMILKMIDEFGCKSEDIFASLGPSIGPESFEVKEDVEGLFRKQFGENVIIKRSGKTFVDIWKSIEMSLNSVGVFKVEKSMIDTVKYNDYFFSYRKEKTEKRFVALVMIKD